MTKVPLCVFYCKHYIKKQKCKAFPKGIPDNIFDELYKSKHTRVLPNQEGEYIDEKK